MKQWFVTASKEERDRATALDELSLHVIIRSRLQGGSCIRSRELRKTVQRYRDQMIPSSYPSS